MMNQILFVSDIDGTLLKTGQMPRLSVLRAIAGFRRRAANSACVPAERCPQSGSF